MQAQISQNEATEFPDWLSKFIDVYQRLSSDNLELLSTIYHQNVHFIDPMHQVRGLDNLSQYFENLYQNLQQCDFAVDQVLVNENQAAVYWTMSYRHSKLNQGKLVKVSGNTHLK